MNLQTIIEFFRNLTIGQIIGDGLTIVLIFTTFIEISPIKWDPLTSILSWLGNRINKTVRKDVEGLTKTVQDQAQKVDDLDKKVDMKEIDHIRW